MTIFIEQGNIIHNNKSELQNFPNNGLSLLWHIHSYQIAFNCIDHAVFRCIIKAIISHNLFMKNDVKLSVTCITLPV